MPLFGEFPANRMMNYIYARGDTILIANYDTENIVEDGTVILSNGKESVTIPFNIKTRRYEISSNKFPIEAGKTYSLTAKTKDLFVESSTIVPLEQAKIENVKVDTLLEESNFGNKMPTVNLCNQKEW